MSEETPTKYKVFNDPIHGNIEIHPLCVRIIDTPQFQRLRHIKQLGGCYYVYPGASHNRFEHSIGVCYLAGKLCDKLRSRQPELNITDVDVLCLKIAGLCHDLGQGPFSRMFEYRFIPHYRSPDKPWLQHDMALKMFEHMVAVNNLQPEFNKFKLTEIDMEFIKELIAGPVLPEEVTHEKPWPFFGRGPEKGFLYEAVVNHRSGIDVDKWDSLARDSKHLGIHSNFDYKRFKKFARIIPDKGIHVLCVRDKEVDTMLTMCQTFLNLSRNAYKHKTTAIIEYMIGEAFRLANDHLLIGPNGDKRMSESVDDVAAYTQLTDSIYYEILHSDEDELAAAREILNKIARRKHYRCIARKTAEAAEPRLNWENKIRDAMKQEFERMRTTSTLSTDVNIDDIVVLVEKFDYGDHRGNPVESIKFYTKLEPTKPAIASADQVSDVLPDSFTEEKIFVYCKRTDRQIIMDATRCFENICNDIGLETREITQRTPDSQRLEDPDE